MAARAPVSGEGDCAAAVAPDQVQRRGVLLLASGLGLIWTTW